MAIVKAFKGLRYSKQAGELGELCCPPYDIINAEERQALLDKNKHNIIRLELPCPPGSENATAYKEAQRVLYDWLADGVLADDKEENIYVYEFSFKRDGITRSVKGFIALVKLEEFEKGIILPHEETLSKAKTDRFNLMSETGCNFSQIYSLYFDKENAVQEVLQNASADTPMSEFTDKDDVTHKLWKIANTTAIAKIAEIMSDKKVFIADGHHRYETALHYYKEVGQKKSDEGTSAFVPMMLVNMENPGLVVWPTHRIVRGLEQFNEQDLVAKSAEYFDITEGLDLEKSQSLSHEACEQGKNAFVLYSGGRYTLMVLKDKAVMKTILPDVSENLRELDVSVLHSLVLERLFGIDKANMAAQKNLTYTRSLDEAIAEVDNGNANCSFLLNSTPIEEISNVASSGGKMPQKSTYFYPKLTTGLVMNRIFK
jgi:uncharacterized protein (DUF1015 family)